MWCGVDEAGRGPIIGPLVLAGVCIDSEDELPSGLKESKQLSAARREQLFAVISRLPHAIRVVHPTEIDKRVLLHELNWLEADKTAEILNTLMPETAIIDCPSRNIAAYRTYLAAKAPGINFVVQFKADREHPVVAAASILAKVTRDRIIEEMKRETGVDFGSGYLTDPKTHAFLEAFEPDFPHFRTSWKPYQERLRALQERQQKLF